MAEQDPRRRSAAHGSRFGASGFVLALLQLGSATEPAVALAALGQPTGEPSGPPPTVTAPSPEASPSGDETEASKQGPLSWRGRVFAQALFREHPLPGTDPDRSLDLIVPSARFGLRYKASAWVGLVVEVDVAGRPEMKDGFVQAKSKQWMSRFGQFKMPLLAITFESPWRLPTARRGLVNEILVDQMQIAGRRPGAVAAWNGGGWLDPEITIGVFQGSIWLLKDPVKRDEFKLEPIEGLTLGSQARVVRIAVKPAGVDLGAYGEWRVALSELGKPRHFWTGGLDVVVEHTFESQGVRAWFDAVTGESWIDFQSRDNFGFDDDFTKFFAARALVAWRWGGIDLGAGYVEPYAYLGFLEPDVEVSADLIWEIKLGLNVGKWNRARLTLEYEVQKVGPNVPYYYVTNKDRPALAREGKAVLLQAGVAF